MKNIFNQTDIEKIKDIFSTILSDDRNYLKLTISDYNEFDVLNLVQTYFYLNFDYYTGIKFAKEFNLQQGTDLKYKQFIVSCGDVMIKITKKDGLFLLKNKLFTAIVDLI